MRRTSLAILSLLMTASFAGCFAVEDEPSTAASGTEDSTSSSLGGNLSDNTPPLLSVTIQTNGTDVELVNDTYAVPVGENITFDASASTDAEDLNLTFTWDLGDGNTSNNATFVYAYETAGSYNVTVTVSDSQGAQANQTLPLLVASSGPAPGTVLAVQKQTFTGTLTLGLQTTACGAGSGGSKSHDFIIADTDAETAAPVQVTRFLLKLTGGSTNVDSDLEFYAPDGKLLKASTGSSATETIDLEGTYAPGKYVVKVVGCIAANASYTINAEAHRVVA